jgi:hypothetical protein
MRNIVNSQRVAREFDHHLQEPAGVSLAPNLRQLLKRRPATVSLGTAHENSFERLTGS